MKFVKIIIFLFFVYITNQGFATICTSTGDGNWMTIGTWSCGRVPADGDTVVIRASDTITINTNINTGYTQVIYIDGAIFFDNGKLNLSSTSQIFLNPGGRIYTFASNSNNDFINFGGGTGEWSGKDGNLSGPLVIDINGRYLPIVLLSCNADQISDEVIKISWTTGYEKNVKFYDIQQSKNGFDFESIAKIEPKNDGVKINSYQFTDNSPFLDGEVVYYKIIFEEFDGTQKAIALKKITYTSVNPHQLKIFPNPSKGDVFITKNFMLKEDESVDIIIHDNQGKVVYQSIIGEFDGRQLLFEHGNTLSSGMYIVSFKTNSAIWKQKLVLN